MRRIFLLALGFLSAAAAQAAPAPPKPNVVIFLADDLGWNGVGFHEKGFPNTPNLNRIAREGVQFERFYASPMCSPTRAGLLTGRYPMRFGMARSVVRPWAKYGLPPEEQTLPEALAAAGYNRRGAFGKWHLGHLDPKWHPLQQGFTQFVGCYNGACDYFTRMRDGQVDWHDGYKDIQPEGYATDLIAEAAEKFIRDHKKDDGPFLCYVPFTAVHDPAQATDEYLKRYPNLKDEKKIVAAQAENMDAAIGRVLKAVEDIGAKNDTLVWFLSDNGGVRHIEENNHPFREGKLTCYEGGIRVAAAAWWPGHVEGGRKVATPLVNVDIMPTVLALAGAKAAGKPLDGVDAFPALTGKGELAPRDIYAFNGQQGLENEQIAVTSPDGFKLIVTGPDIRRNGGSIDGRKVELFNLNTDPTETSDLASAEPARVKELAQKAIAFRKSEPANYSVPPLNRKPKDFVVPANWNNAPEGK